MNRFLFIALMLCLAEGCSMTIDELVSNPAEEGVYQAMRNCISYLHDNPTLEIEGVDVPVKLSHGY